MRSQIAAKYNNTKKQDAIKSELCGERNPLNNILCAFREKLKGEIRVKSAENLTPSQNDSLCALKMPLLTFFFRYIL
jgi:hypothetical protein